MTAALELYSGQAQVLAKSRQGYRLHLSACVHQGVKCRPMQESRVSDGKVAASMTAGLAMCGYLIPLSILRRNGYGLSAATCLHSNMDSPSVYVVHGDR